jgi:DNA-binding GntR family transcriptional regulator
MSTNLTPRNDQERTREVTEARAALERRAAELGITPFDADEWFAGTEDDQAPEDAAREVGEFLSIVRELRDTPSTRSAG